MKLFCTNNVSTVVECRLFNIALPSELLSKRTEKFLRKLNAHCGYLLLTVQGDYFYFIYLVISPILCFFDATISGESKIVTNSSIEV